METCTTQKDTIWVQSLRTLRHRSMQVLTHIAAQLQMEKWSIVEDRLGFMGNAGGETQFRLSMQDVSPIARLHSPLPL